MKVLLISANTEMINMPVLPLGLACIAAAVDGRRHTPKVLNLMLHADIQRILKDTLVDFNPEVIGLSVRNIDDQNMQNPRFLLNAVKDVVDTCRKYSDAAIVVGGAGYSIFPQAALDFLGADIGIQGDGERSFLTLLEKFHDKSDLENIPGLHLPGQTGPRAGRYSKDLSDIALPLPDVHLSMPSALNDQKIWMPFQTRRGCPMDCSYCSTAAIEGRTIRKHDPEKVVEALSRYVEAGIDHFFFVDNTFNLPNSYAKRLCEHLIASQLKFTWRCILYPWKVDDVLVEQMAKAGCREVSLGFESGSEKILALMNKKYKPAEVRQISGRLKKYGIRRMGFLLLGGPGETKETTGESLRFADSLALEAVKVTVGIRMYPNTPLSKIAVKEGLIKADDNLLFPKFYITKDLQNWLPQTVNAWTASRPNWIW
jgi:radical SAM superfamily enzyme YgiQ (UPF0313 family)